MPQPAQELARETLDALARLRDQCGSVASELLSTLPVTGSDRLQSALDAWTDDSAALARALSLAAARTLDHLPAATGVEPTPSAATVSPLPTPQPYLPKAPR